MTGREENRREVSREDRREEKMEGKKREDDSRVISPTHLVLARDLL